MIYEAFLQPVTMPSQADDDEIPQIVKVVCVGYPREERVTLVTNTPIEFRTNQNIIPPPKAD